VSGSTRRNSRRASSRVSSRYLSIFPHTKHLLTSISSSGYDSYTSLPPHFLQQGRFTIASSVALSLGTTAPYQALISRELIGRYVTRRCERRSSRFPR